MSYLRIACVLSSKLTPSSFGSGPSFGVLSRSHAHCFAGSLPCSAVAFSFLKCTVTLCNGIWRRGASALVLVRSIDKQRYETIISLTMGKYRECAVCSIRFIAKRTTRRFCSDQCRLKSHRAVWNNASGTTKLVELLRQVADTIDRGEAAHRQVVRLRALLSEYDRHHHLGSTSQKTPKQP